MAKWDITINKRGLLDYAKAGRDAVRDVQKVVRSVMNSARKTARRRIAAEFRTRTGYLKRQSRRMQTKAIVSRAEVKGQVLPIPRLMNIFERGATLAHGRGFLRPRPVVRPAQEDIIKEAPRKLDEILAKVGK